MWKKKTSTEGSGITKKIIHHDYYSIEATSDRNAMHDTFLALTKVPKGPWRGRQDEIKRIRLDAKRLLDEAVAKDSDPSKIPQASDYFEARVDRGWYVCKAADITYYIENALRQGRHWEAVCDGIALGEILTELKIKEKWEEAALFGDKQMGARRSGGRKNEKYKPDVVTAFVDALLNPSSGKPGIGKDAAVSLAAEKFKLSKSTIYAKLLRAKENDSES